MTGSKIGGRALFYAWLGIMLAAGGSLHAETKSFKVVNHSGVGVPSEVYRLGGDGKKERLGKTGPDGQFQTEHQCSQGQRILVEPEDSATYFRNKLTECPLQETTKVVVTRKTEFAGRSATANSLKEAGQLKEAADLYESLVKEADGFGEPEISNELSKTLKNLDKKLKPEALDRFKGGLKFKPLPLDIKSAPKSTDKSK